MSTSSPGAASTIMACMTPIGVGTVTVRAPDSAATGRTTADPPRLSWAMSWATAATPSGPRYASGTKRKKRRPPSSASTNTCEALERHHLTVPAGQPQ